MHNVCDFAHSRTQVQHLTAAIYCYVHPCSGPQAPEWEIRVESGSGFAVLECTYSTAFISLVACFESSDGMFCLRRPVLCLHSFLCGSIQKRQGWGRLSPGGGRISILIAHSAKPPLLWDVQHPWTAGRCSWMLNVLLVIYSRLCLLPFSCCSLFCHWTNTNPCLGFCVVTCQLWLLWRSFCFDAHDRRF